MASTAGWTGTSDNARTAEAVARQVGIDRVLADVLPRDKALEIQKLQLEGKVVAMVGDGITDAPALAQADVGMATGTGTDVAIEASDITLIKGSLTGVVIGMEISSATVRNVYQNLIGSFRHGPFVSVHRSVALAIDCRSRHGVQFGDRDHERQSLALLPAKGGIA